MKRISEAAYKRLLSIRHHLQELQTDLNSDDVRGLDFGYGYDLDYIGSYFVQPKINEYERTRDIDIRWKTLNRDGNCQTIAHYILLCKGTYVSVCGESFGTGVGEYTPCMNASESHVHYHKRCEYCLDILREAAA